MIVSINLTAAAETTAALFVTLCISDFSAQCIAAAAADVAAHNAASTK